MQRWTSGQHALASCALNQIIEADEFTTAGKLRARKSEANSGSGRRALSIRTRTSPPTEYPSWESVNWKRA